MKRILYPLIACVALILSGCSNDEPSYNNLPQKISTFISQYYPNTSISSFTADSDGYDVVIKDGPTFEFDKQYSWTEVDGNGSVIVQEFLFDQLPQPLYEYLETTGNLSQVFKVERDSKEYEVTLLTTEITYNRATHQVTGVK